MRKVHWTAFISVTLSFWFMFWLLCIMGFWGMTKTSFYLESRQPYIGDHGITGYITKIEDDTTSKPRRVIGKKYDYTYTYDGRFYDGKANGGLPQQYFEEQKVDVLIDPANPSVSRLPNTTNVTIPPWICFGLAAVATLIFSIMFANAAKRYKTIKYGVTTTATVDNQRRDISFKNGRYTGGKRKIFNPLAYRGVKSIPIIYHTSYRDSFLPLTSLIARWDNELGVWKSNILLVILKLIFLTMVISSGVSFWFASTL
jgi:hypothetical protein